MYENPHSFSKSQKHYVCIKLSCPVTSPSLQYDTTMWVCETMTFYAILSSLMLRLLCLDIRVLLSANRAKLLAAAALALSGSSKSSKMMLRSRPFNFFVWAFRGSATKLIRVSISLHPQKTFDNHIPTTQPSKTTIFITKTGWPLVRTRGNEAILHGYDRGFIPYHPTSKPPHQHLSDSKFRAKSIAFLQELGFLI